MSKIYFTKLLPVEGEIKDKDWYWDKLNKIYEQAYPESNFEWLNSGAFPKVKLFLCSRDIQVGDENIKGESELSKVHNQDHLDSINLANKFVPNSYFKVIGEISSDAVWVKEGDEFDKNDWQLYGHHEDDYIPGYVEKDCLNENWFIIDFCKIKCSQCKKFH